MSITQFPPVGNSASAPDYVVIGGTQVDAFGRHRVSNPYTLFDSQARYGPDNTYSYSTATGGTTVYNTNQSSVSLNVTTASGSSVVAQSYRSFSYQPGKSLLTMQTFTMNAAKTGLRQRIGYFGTNNGIYLEQDNGTVSFVNRTFTSGTVNNSRTIPQASWNGDKMDGTGPSGVTLDLTKTQILFFDFEWLGVGNVRCGFVINGQYVVCHTFQNANFQTVVYMQTAILPLRYEITNTATTASSSVMQQICSTVISEGGYDQISQPYIARPTASVTVGTSFAPLVSIRLNAGHLGAIVIPTSTTFLPIGTGNYEIVLIKNATLTGATWASTLSSGQVDVDVAATSLTNTADNIVNAIYSTATNQGAAVPYGNNSYNWDLQLGVSVAGVSDTYTLAARTLTGTNACLGMLTYYNLTV